MAKMLDQRGVKTLTSSLIGATKTINGQSIWGSGNINAGGSITESPKSPYGFQPVLNCARFGTSAPHTGGNEFTMLKEIIKKISLNSQDMNPVGVNDIFIAMLNGMHVYSDWFHSYGYWDYFIDGWDGNIYDTIGTTANNLTMEQYVINFRLHVTTVTPQISGSTRQDVHWTSRGYAMFITNMPTHEQSVNVLSMPDDIDGTDVLDYTDLEIIPEEGTVAYWTYACKNFSEV